MAARGARGILAAALAWVAGAQAATVEVRLIGVRELEGPAASAGAPRAGGLSGLDYDAAADRWIAVSDDRGEHGPARACALRLDYDAHGFTRATVTETILLETPAGERPDLEAVRIDPRDGRRWLATEGDAARGTGPAVWIVDRHGRKAGEFSLPAALRFDPAGRRGPRGNLNLEGLAFTSDGAALWLGLEAPLLEDGPVTGAARGALVRLTRCDRDGAVQAQHAYALDAWPLTPAAGKRADNGLAELLAADAGTLLVLERGGAEDAAGGWRFAVRLYAATLAGATDVRGLATLAGAAVTPVAKRLVFDFAANGATPGGNVEGLAWGRRTSAGRATLVAISDDNFDPQARTQVWVFEVLSFP